MMQSSVKMNSPATLQLDCAKPTHIVIWTEDSPLSALVNRINDLESKFNSLLATVAAAAPSAPSVAAAPSAAAPSAAAPSAPSATPGLYFPPSLSPHLSGLNVQAAEVNVDVDVDVDVELPLEAEQPEDEQVEEELEEEVEEEVEEEEEVMQNLTEFEWKDKAGVVQTYWRDSDNQVYEKDEDGDLNDTPIGIWNEAKQKLQRYAKAA
jgi:hypothetical protein